MADTGVCVRCAAGEDGDEVEVDEAGLCTDCAGEEAEDEMGAPDTGEEEE
jgi:NMD protein affecting ribosome stability and mRNA decay